MILLGNFPISVSLTVLAASVGVLCMLSAALLLSVKWLINEKAWGEEFINPWLLYEKVNNILFKKEVVRGDEVMFESNKYTLKQCKDSELWYYGFSDGCKGLEFRGSKPYLSCSKYRNHNWTMFKTKEDATTGKVLRFNPVWVLAPLGLDILIKLFTLEPFATTLLTGVSLLVLSVRWLSGKLANNVKKTNNHEQRINKLEEK